MSAPRLAHGIWASIVSSLAFATMDATTKGLMQTMNPSFALVWRSALLLCGVLVWISVTRRSGTFATTAPLTTAIRSFFFGLTSLLVVISMKYLSLAETMAIYFLNPVIAVPLSAFLLREPVGRWAIPAAALGFAGVLFVMQPDMSGIRLAYLLPLGAAFSGATHDVMSRQLKGRTAPLTLMIYGILASLVWGLLTADWSQARLPEGREWALVFFAAGVGFIANLFVIVSFHLVSASLAAPLRYMLLAWSALIGYLVWGQYPNFYGWIGVLLILGAGLLAIASSLKPLPAAEVQP